MRQGGIKMNRTERAKKRKEHQFQDEIIKAINSTLSEMKGNNTKEEVRKIIEDAHKQYIKGAIYPDDCLDALRKANAIVQKEININLPRFPWPYYCTISKDEESRIIFDKDERFKQIEKYSGWKITIHIVHVLRSDYFANWPNIPQHVFKRIKDKIMETVPDIIYVEGDVTTVRTDIQTQISKENTHAFHQGQITKLRKKLKANLIREKIAVNNAHKEKTRT